MIILQLVCVFVLMSAVAWGDEPAEYPMPGPILAPPTTAVLTPESDTNSESTTYERVPVRGLTTESVSGDHDDTKTPTSAAGVQASKSEKSGLESKQESDVEPCEICKSWWQQHTQVHAHKFVGEALFSLKASREAADRIILPDTLATIAEPSVIKSNSTTIGAADDPETDRSTTGSPDDPEFGYVIFGESARFPIRGFDRHGKPVERDAAVIYEGMAIQVDEQGNYTVKFTMEAPSTEATVRLQFVVWKKLDPKKSAAGKQPRCKYRKIATLTLPPLRFIPGRDESRSGHALVWKVEQTGYSPLLMCLNGDVKCPNDHAEKSRFRVTRSGSAEFGSVPVRTASY